MVKELPKMYHNRIEKDISNNEKVFSTLYDNISDKNDSGFFIDNRNNYTIEQKIHNIFNSPNYIYKIDVVIVTDKGKENKRIVGKTKTNLITMDNEYIPFIFKIFIKNYKRTFMNMNNIIDFLLNKYNK